MDREQYEEVFVKLVDLLDAIQEIKDQFNPEDDDPLATEISRAESHAEEAFKIAGDWLSRNKSPESWGAK